MILSTEAFNHATLHILLEILLLLLILLIVLMSFLPTPSKMSTTLHGLILTHLLLIPFQILPFLHLITIHRQHSPLTQLTATTTTIKIETLFYLLLLLQTSFVHNVQTKDSLRVKEKRKEKRIGRSSLHLEAPAAKSFRASCLYSRKSSNLRNLFSIPGWVMAALLGYISSGCNVYFSFMYYVLLL